MDRSEWFKKRNGFFWMAAVGGAVLAALVMPASYAYTDGESISVSCFKGDKGQGENLGNMMIFAPESAGRSCNSFYYNCYGKCYGCFSDFDLGVDVCYDNAGRKFLK
jgi:hypothetical protein